MAYQATVYNVMIASPSDILEERHVVREVLTKWNIIHAENRHVVLLPIGWETHSIPETGDHPQSILNRQILEQSDLLVGLFWTRLGTPTDKYVSGSAEEINRHVDAGKPAMLYFSDQPAKPSSVDPEQYRRLQQFKDKWNAHALIGEWENPSDFREKFDSQLQMKLNKDPYFQNLSAPETQPAPLNSGPSLTLSDDAERLLVAAKEEGTIECMRSIDLVAGVSIDAGGQSFTEDTHRSVARWSGAVKELECSGFIEDRAGKQELYFVTHKGFRVIDELNVGKVEGKSRRASDSA